MATLLIDEVREYVSDYAPNNYLIDGEEFTDTFIALCIELGVDSYNSMTPRSNFNLLGFPSKLILLLGTCAQMYQAKAALLARNTMQYSDGGLQIPIEERAELYQGLANSFRQQFREAAQALKIQQNMESGWGEIRSDESRLPWW
jgi:hypothetical protein